MAGILAHHQIVILLIINILHIMAHQACGKQDEIPSLRANFSKK
jgi:hypothetical protein